MDKGAGAESGIASPDPKYLNAMAGARKINRPFTVTRKNCDRGYRVARAVTTLSTSTGSHWAVRLPLLSY
jgi:hypothetical protein